MKLIVLANKSFDMSVLFPMMCVQTANAIAWANLGAKSRYIYNKNWYEWSVSMNTLDVWFVHHIYKMCIKKI